jgi:ATP-dependent DNA helicase RecG
VVLFGNMPNYPQCEIRMARFRGTDKAELMDQRSVRGPAFKLLEEAQLFCERHFPLPAKIVPTQLRRVETPLIPPDALREILVNAIIHRDYSNSGGAMFLAIYDDRVEIGSIGAFPRGITADLLRRRHKSVLRNPIIADTFHRTGLIERWGRGTNRVAEMCKAADIAPPTFEGSSIGVDVTFHVPVAQGRPTGQVTDQVTDQVTGEVAKLLGALRAGPLAHAELMAALGLKHLPHFRAAYVAPALARGFIEMTIPDKPNSRFQTYQLTATGRAVLDAKERG